MKNLAARLMAMDRKYIAPEDVSTAGREKRIAPFRLWIDLECCNLSDLRVRIRVLLGGEIYIRI